MDDKALKEEQLTLELLDAIEKDSDISQRHLAKKMGIALGLANSYLKRCIKKGLIKIHDAPANRYLYYVTPKGFTEKSRLTASYLSYSFSFYREAGDSCRNAYLRCKDKGWDKIVLCGISDLAEIAILRSYETNIDIVGLYDPHTENTQFINNDVFHDFAMLPEHDGYMITELNATTISYEHLITKADPSKVIIPDILRLDK